jgi:DNA-binding MarR family transcriptional regulator
MLPVVSGVSRAGDEPPAAVFDIEQSLGFLVHRLAETLEARLMVRLDGEGLSLPAYRILAVLLKHPECRSVDLAERAGIEPPTASRQVSALREKGLVERRRSGSDARTVRISLTGSGRALAVRLTAASRQAEQEYLQRFSASERREFLAALGAVREAVLAAPGVRPRLRRARLEAARPGAPLR